MKKIFALIIVLLVIVLEGLLAAPIQPVDSIGVKWVNGKKFIEHKIEAREGWYGIARKYGISQKDLKNANKDSGDQLSVGRIILVPAGKNETNDAGNPKKYAQPKPGMEEPGEPVYHLVKQKETLYAIAKKYKVKANQIKEWNQLQSKVLQPGEQLIVGYKKGQPAHEITEEKPEIKPDVNVVGEKIPPENKMELIKDTTTTVQTTEEKKTAADSPGVNKSFTRRIITEQGVATWIEDENINPHKYFALHRTASPGSIIKLTNKMNRRTVFVKVVGKLPDTGDNENVIIKVSKASAEKLGVRDQRFQCDLSYGVSEK